MDTQTTAIIVAIAAVGVTLFAAIVPLLVLQLRDSRHTNRQIVALANHRHGEDGAPTFNLPPD